MKTIFRQAEDSQIITNAHRINQGRYLSLPKGSKAISISSPLKMLLLHWVVDVVTERIPYDKNSKPILAMNLMKSPVNIMKTHRF
ncbi:MAG: hypothetical protein HN916_07985 [Anaerolineae bacterium]|jgi:hypothetical protein|nr:hypothetical protein [Anaerolineae bacterium]